MLRSPTASAGRSASTEEPATTPPRSSTVNAGAVRSSARSAPTGNKQAAVQATHAGANTSAAQQTPQPATSGEISHGVQSSGPSSGSGQKTETSPQKNHEQPGASSQPSQVTAAPAPEAPNLPAPAMAAQMPLTAAEPAAHPPSNTSQPSPFASAESQSSAGSVMTSLSLSETSPAAASSPASPSQAGSARPAAGGTAGTQLRTVQKREAGLLATVGAEAVAASAAERPVVASFTGAATATAAQEQQEPAAANFRSSGDKVENAEADRAPAQNNSAMYPPGPSGPIHPAAVAGAQHLSSAADIATAPQSALPEQATTRAASHADSHVAPSPMNPLTLPSSSQGIEAATLLRGTEGTPSLPGAASSYASGTVSVHAGISAEATFTALDAASGVSKPSWVHAGAQHAEAGFQDPALGWVGVRANLNAGNVHAALMPESAEAAQVLSGTLAGLSAYLAEQHTPAATLTIADPAGRAVENGADQSLQQGAGQNAEQRAPQEAPSSLPNALTMPAISAQGSSTAGNEFNATVWPSEGRGVHISVMA